MIIDTLLAISLFTNVFLLHKYGQLIIRNRETEKRLTAVSELLAGAIIKQTIKPTHERLDELNVNREN